MTNVVDGNINLYSNQDYEQPDIIIKSATGFNLNIECNELNTSDINCSSLTGNPDVIIDGTKIDFLINNVSKMKLESNTLTIPRLVSSIGAYTYSYWRNTQSQVLNSLTLSSILFNTLLINNIGLTTSLVALSGATQGTRFTNNTLNDMILSVSFMTSCSANVRTDSNLFVEDNPIAFAQQTLGNQPGSNYNVNGSAIIILPVGKYCEVRTFSNGLSSTIGIAENIQFFRLA